MKNCSRRRRNRKAMALVSIVVLGAFAIAVMMGMFQLALNVTRSETASRISADLRNATEAGVDYGIQMMNDSIVSGDPSPVYNVLKDLPTDYFPIGFDGQIKVKVRDLTDEEWKLFAHYGAGYSTELDPDYGIGGAKASDYNHVTRTNVKTRHFKVVESTAKRGLFSRSLKVILEPRFDQPPGYSDFRSLTGVTQASYFANPAFGNSQISVSPASPLVIQADQDPSGDYPLKLQSNKGASLGNDVELQGDLLVSNNPGNPSSVGAGTSNSKVDGRVVSNADTDGFTGTPGTNAAPGDNVLANAEGPTGRSGLNSSAPTDSDAGLTQVAVSPVPSSSSTQNLNLGSNSVLTQGSYSTPSLSTASTSAVKTDGNTVKIFIQDGSNTGSAADISASLLKNMGTVESLQIWYEGARPINLNLDSSFKGVIYAPNSKITLSGNQSFEGALVSDSLVLNNTGSMKFSTSLSTPTNSGNNQLDPHSYYLRNGEPAIQGYKAISWQEFNKAILNMN